ncbi:Atu4866 domain-containing protein [Roseomonas sp. ACRSG]|nr:Atu4866 domain-containing protein [Roseomonas sp. ACRSG]
MRNTVASVVAVALGFLNPNLVEATLLRATHPYAGMWVTDDGRVRHQLLPDGRYDEARGSRESAYRGRYEVTGTHIDYWDDTGFTADGTFVDADTLHHGGMVLRRRQRPGEASSPP